MPARAHLLRQFRLVRRLQAARRRALPFTEIQRYLLTETSVGDFESGYSQRTFQRDVREIVDLFGITIKARKTRGITLPKPRRYRPTSSDFSRPLSYKSFCSCRQR